MAQTPATMSGSFRARPSQSNGGQRADTGSNLRNGGSSSNARRGGSADEQDGEMSMSPSTFANLSTVLPRQDPASDESIQEVLTNIDSSKGLMGPPSTAAYRRPVMVGSLSSRKPNLHLSLGAGNSQNMSRFSAFSSNEGTPSGESIRRGNQTLGSPSFSRAGSSSAVSNAASSTSVTPSTDTVSMAGLGIGMLSTSKPSSQALNDLGVLSTSSSQSLSPKAAIYSSSNNSQHTAFLSHLPPQTPDRFHIDSIESSHTSSLQTPARSPANTYDRAGQIGIGELSTPRWTSNINTQGWPTQPNHSMPERLSNDTPTIQRQTNDGESRHSRAISFSATAPLQSRQSASRGTTAPQAPQSVLSPPRDLHNTMIPSPSMPTFGPSLGGVSSLATLAHQFNDNEEKERAVKKPRQSDETSTVSRTEVDTPDYSINAMSESEDEIGTDIMPPSLKKLIRSPLIGDTAWSEGETGPFAVASSSSNRREHRVLAERNTKRDEGKEKAGQEGEAKDYSQGFDLDTAIGELSFVEEARKRARKVIGMDIEKGHTSTRSSGDQPSSLRGHNDAGELSNQRTPMSRKSQGSEKDRDNEGNTSARRLRRTSSPLVTKTTSMARLPSSSSAQSIASAKKRSSSASIGHSLLRGSLPFGASEEYEGILSSGGDATAEALRMLDGAGYTRRSSMSRDREQSKSPRTSKQMSRPSSAGRRASGNASPTSKVRENSHSNRQQQQQHLHREEGKVSSSQRTSRSLGKVKNADEVNASASMLPLDSPKRLSYSSPRIKRSALPPLPSHSIPGIASPLISNANLSTSTNSNSDHRFKDTSRRASAASIASSNVSANRSLIATTTKSNRTSDSSMLDSQGNGSTGQILAGNVDDQSASPITLGLDVPPVPPLPKAWEGSRTTSMHSIDNSISQMTTSSSNGSWVRSSTSQQQQQQLPPPPSNQQSTILDTVPASHTVTKKWSFANLGGSLASKKSEERLTSRKSLAALPSPSRSLQMEQEKGVTTRLPQPSSLAGGVVVNARSPSENMSQSSLLSPTIRSEQTIMNPVDGAVAPTPVSASFNSQALQSPSVATFRSRRTPSFFRKRSSDALGDQSSSNDRQGNNASTASQESSDKARTDIPTPSSGRSSRKSIMGIGNILRNASKRNIDTMPTSLPPSASVDKSVDELGEDSAGMKESSGRVSSTPRIPSLKNIRRASLIGRKRGKTLPSATDPPSATLSSNQSSLFADSPSLSASSRPLQDSAISTATTSKSIKIPNEKISDGSHGDLSISTNDLMPNDETMQLPSITASPFVVPSAPRMEKDSSVDGNSKRNPDGFPASRIPRATTYGSIKRNNYPALSSAQSTAPTKRKDGTSALSSLSSSNTAFSLAANLGITHEGEDSSTTSSLGSSTLMSILNAYTNAKTPAEVEVVLRRARVVSHSSTTSAREKEVLVSLVSRQEQKKQADIVGETISEAISSTHLSRTPKASEAHRLNSALSSSSNGHVPINNSGSSSVPRRTRISMTTSTASTRAAREATALSASMSTSRTSQRLSATPTHTRQSPALVDVTSTPNISESNIPLLPPASTTIEPLNEEREGDEEMEAYIRRRHQKKVAQGARLADLEKMLQFPEDIPPSKCYSYRQAEAIWGDKLTELELEEMRNFKEVYFVGQNVDKRARLQVEQASANNLGYDDERGDYLVINHDHLAYRYEVTSLLGRGSFGQVLQCRDHKTGKSVAIKLIRNKKRFHHQALVEVKILDNLVKWDPNDEHNVIKILDSFYFRNHLCISMEMLSINLYELIKANSFVGFSTKLIRRLTSQVLASLTLLRKNRVVHCDLKPENILLMHPRKSAIKVIDFGSSCFEHEKVYTYIQSRFYRSPEVILGMNYHTAIDIWSMACIMAELYSGYPLFPGENEQEQLACIMEILGPPDRYLVDKSSRKKLFFDSTGAPRPVVNSKGRRRRPNTKTLSSALNCNDELFLDFLTKCLHWDPDKRMKPEAALRHPWIKRSIDTPASLTTKVANQLSSSATSSNISGPTSRRAMFTSMTSSSSSASLSKGGGISSSSNAVKPSNLSSHHGGTAKSALAAPLASGRNNNNAAVNAAMTKPARHERRISLRNNLNSTGPASSSMNTSSPLRKQPVS